MITSRGKGEKHARKISILENNTELQPIMLGFFFNEY